MKLSEIIKRTFITRKCIICGELISYDEKEPFCEKCSELWESQVNIKCKRCSYDREYCMCLPDKVKSISHGVAVWSVFYDSSSENQMNNIVYTIKRQGYRDSIDFCAGEIKKRLLYICNLHNINPSEYEITYPSRKRSGISKYGFDHVKRLANALSAKLGIKSVRLFANCGKDDQKELNKRERLKNAQKSYKIINAQYVSGKKFFLVDDVMTTGATLYACANLLYENGAADVIPVTYAKDNF